MSADARVSRIDGVWLALVDPGHRSDEADVDEESLSAVLAWCEAVSGGPIYWHVDPRGGLFGWGYYRACNDGRPCACAVT